MAGGGHESDGGPSLSERAADLGVFASTNESHLHRHEVRRSASKSPCGSAKRPTETAEDRKIGVRGSADPRNVGIARNHAFMEHPDATYTGFEVKSGLARLGRNIRARSSCRSASGSAPRTRPRPT